MVIKKKPWSVLATECVDEYNKTTHSTTKYAPIYLLYGQKVDLCPIETLADDLEEDRRIALKNTMRDFERNKLRIDEKRADQELNVDDLVFVDRGNKLNRNKLDTMREGPFRIIEKISPLMYKVDAGNKKETSNIFHKNQIHTFPFSKSDRKEGGCNAI